MENSVKKNFTEKIDLLSTKDIATIKKKAKTTNIVLGFTTVFFALMYFIFNSSLIVAMIFVLFPVGIIVFTQLTLRRDLKSGQKKIICGFIDEKIERTNNSYSSQKKQYFFKIGEQEIEIEPAHYNSYQTGNKIEIAQTLASKAIIYVKEYLEKEHTNSEEKEIPKKKISEGITPEIFSSNTQYMLEEEVRYIGKKRNRRLIINSLVALILGFVVYKFLSVVLLTIFIFAQITKPEILKAITPATLVLVCGLAIFIVYLRIIKLQKDFQEKYKEILTYRIEDKISNIAKAVSTSVRTSSLRNNFHYLVFGGIHYSVNKDEFDKAKIGEKIELHRSMHSHTPLFLKTFESKIEIKLYVFR